MKIYFSMTPLQNKNIEAFKQIKIYICRLSYILVSLFLERLQVLGKMDQLFLVLQQLKANYRQS